MGQQALRQIIRSIDPCIYELVLLAGGEPSLNPDLIKVAIDACHGRNLATAIVTAPIWAKTPVSASHFLSQVGGVNMVILSYDLYHLEFVSAEYYQNALNACANVGVPAIGQISYTAETERDELARSLNALGTVAHINSMRTVSVGNAAHMACLGMEQLSPLQTVNDLDRIPRTCVAGNSFVDEEFRVHGCCWASAVELSPLTIRASATSLGDAFADLEQRPAFISVRTRGFLNALDESSREILVQALRGQRHATECDVCMASMSKPLRHLWEGALGEKFAGSRAIS